MCDILIDKFGYKHYPLHYIDYFEFTSGSYGSILDRNAVEENLSDLGLSDEEIEESLIEELEHSLWD